MKKILILFIFVLTTVPIFTQDFCATESDYPNSLQNIDFNFISTNGPYSVRVFFHIIRRSNGTGGQSSAILPNCLNILNNDFNAHNINFINGGNDFIDSDDFFGYVDDQTCSGCTDCDFTQLINTRIHEDAIDIYILPPYVFNGGRASGIPGRALVIGGNATFNGVNSSLPVSQVLSHEMGHCLGLFHTFHGTCTCENRDCNGNTVGCPELVNGTNGTTCGDLVSDTPADPIRLFSVSLGSTCTWNNTTMRDANNQLYNPDERLIMAYTYPQCMQLFTNGQGTRMREHLATSSILQSRIIPNDIFIQNETFSSGQTILTANNSITAGRSVTTGSEGDVVVTTNSDVAFQAGSVIKLMPGFNAVSGSQFLAKINSSFAGAPKLFNNSTKTYYNFLNNDNWFVVSRGLDGEITKTNYSIVKDTVINATSYSKISECVNSIIYNEQEIPCRYFYIREDIDNHLVYLYDIEKDVLIYDFNLNIGDKLPGTDEQLLESIDSVYINSEKRTRLTFSNPNFAKSIWIEGIGNIANPFISNSIVDEQQKLICVKKGENIIYDNGEFYGITCNDNTAIAPAIIYDKSKISLGPNPTTGILTISNSTNDPISEINIFNGLGQILMTINSSKIASGQVDISTLSPDIYFVNLRTTTKSYTVPIILKK